MVTQLFKVVAYRKEFPPIDLHDTSLVGIVLLGNVTNKIHVSTCRRPMKTKIFKVLDLLQEALTLKAI